MSRGTRIRISLPEGFTKISLQEQDEFLFEYLKNIGFSKQNFSHPIEINEYDESFWEYHIEQLSDIQEDMELDTLIGAYYMIHKIKPSVLSYDKLCAIATDLRGGFSLYYHRDPADRSEELNFRDSLQNWIDMVLSESEEDLDIEVRRAEFRQYKVVLDKLSKVAKKNSTIYVTLTRPASPIRKSFSQVERKLTEIQRNEQINT